jgi:acylphosphatase
MSGLSRAHVYVSGRVQGVWFREACRGEANVAGVGGWVRNLADGRVEAVFDGAEAAVEHMVAWCHDGPARARVEAVEVRREQPTGEPGFHVR